MIESSEKSITRRGTSNSNSRGNSKDRAARKKWLLSEYGNGNTAPCCFCGVELTFETLTVERIVPGCRGGKYVRSNCLPACAPCNSEKGGSLRSVRNSATLSA